MRASKPSDQRGARSPRLRAGDLLARVEVHGLDPRGLGVASASASEGGALALPVLIAGAAPGDAVSARVVHVSPHAPHTAWAEVAEVISRGDGFTHPSCPHAAPLRGACGGCPLMHLSPQAQADWKRQQVQACIDAASPAHSVTATFTASPAPLGYRNRAHYVAALGPNKEPLLGAYAPRSHAVIPQAGCQVVHPLIDATAQALQRALRALAVPIHPAPQSVRYVTLRVAPSTSLSATSLSTLAPQCLVEWICHDLSAPWLPALLDATCALPDVAGAGASLNATDGNALHAAPPALWQGQRTLQEPLGPLSLDLTTDAFSQLNAAVAAHMYARAAALLPPGSAADCIWDLYCGAGALGVTVALRHGTRTLCGAEVNPSALTAARALAAAQGILDARYQTLDLGQHPTPPDWPAPQALLINPPRQGIDPVLLPHVIASPARHLLYMSCSPATLQRDLIALIASGAWRITAAEAHDMLPQTAHVEALVLLERVPSACSVLVLDAAAPTSP